MCSCGVVSEPVLNLSCITQPSLHFSHQAHVLTAHSHIKYSLMLAIVCATVTVTSPQGEGRTKTWFSV